MQCDVFLLVRQGAFVEKAVDDNELVLVLDHALDDLGRTSMSCHHRAQTKSVRQAIESGKRNRHT